MLVTSSTSQTLRPMSHGNQSGEWDEVMAVVKRAVDAVAESSPRVGLVLKADIRPGFTDQLTAKVERIESRLADGRGA